MSVQPKILVTSAAGKTGFPTALQLLEKGFDVKAFVRRKSSRAEMLEKAGAELLVGNMLDVRDVRRALTGVQRAYYCAPFGSNHLHTSMTFLAAAQEANLETITLMTQWFSHASHPSHLTREHWLTDNIMKLLPNTGIVTVAPSIFAEVYLMMLAPIAQLGMFAFPGDALNAPVSNEDIARVVVGTIENPTPYIGKTLRPSGPELIKPSQMANVFGEILGRKIKYMDASETMFLKAVKSMGAPIFEISQVLKYVAELKKGTAAVGAPSNVVEEVSGRKAEDFKSIAHRYFFNDPSCASGFGNKMAALAGFMKLIATRAPNIEKFDKLMDFPVIENPTYSMDSIDWRNSHENLGL